MGTVGRWVLIFGELQRYVCTYAGLLGRLIDFVSGLMCMLTFYGTKVRLCNIQMEDKNNKKEGEDIHQCHRESNGLPCLSVSV